jgi:putative phosphoribosyl transferase
VFRDREEAGRLLAERLKAYRDDPNGLILALPRGGVAVGYTLSLALHLPLDVLITRKLGAPGNPEYAMGAIAETGALILNQEAMRAFALSREDMDKQIRTQQEEIARRQALYRGGRPLPTLTGRTVLLVDDGIATGSTFFASIEALKKLHPMRIVAAIAVGPRETLIRVRQKVDELIVLLTPEPFYAVGNHYEDFTQVEDDAVLRYLAGAAEALRQRHQSLRA